MSDGDRTERHGRVLIDADRLLRRIEELRASDGVDQRQMALAITDLESCVMRVNAAVTGSPLSRDGA